MIQHNTIEELSMDGFQIVKADMFAHLARPATPTCTIWHTKLSFNKLALESLNNCEYIRIEVNPMSKCLVIIPVTSSDINSIRWVKGTKEIMLRNMESKRFGAELYKSWNLNPELNYRAMGRLVSCNRKVMLLFDFKEAEEWKNQKGE